MKRRAIFLDRDGVLNLAVVDNGIPYPPADVGALQITPGANEALWRLKRLGFLLICVTNQPDIARGTRTWENVREMNEAVRTALPLDDLFCCPHDNADNCACRKPKPGMLLNAAKKWGIELAKSWMIGDRAGDMAAGRAAGCRTIFLDAGYAESNPASAADITCANLTQVVETIIHDTTADTSVVPNVQELRVKIFADGADKSSMLSMYAQPYIKGFTTNPTLIRRAGVTDYEKFAREMTAAIPDRPLSFEVFSDDFLEMERQAMRIQSWGENVYVKIPVTNTRGEPSVPLIRRLAKQGVKQNVTAMTTLEQVCRVSEALADSSAAYLSVFAGRIADTGRDPVPVMAAAVETIRCYPSQELIWASPRELLNIYQANAVGCHIITVTTDILKKLVLAGKSLDAYSLETVMMFHNDAIEAGFTIL